MAHSLLLFTALLTANCLIQRAALAGNEAAALFLATHGAKANHVNKWVRTNIWMYNKLGLDDVAKIYITI